MAIGRPESINKTVVKGSVEEQWIYEGWSFNGYIYFNNGKLSAIQN